MAINGTVTIDWANGTDIFNLAIIGIQLDFEEKCGNVGIFEVAERLESTMVAGAEGRLGGRARVNDIREAIRLGLIGGGKAADQAARIIRTHVDTKPLYESVVLAYSIVAAALRGVPDDQVGKGQADRVAAGGSTQKEGVLSDPPSTVLQPA